jgi:hypothetical protein
MAFCKPPAGAETLAFPKIDCAASVPWESFSSQRSFAGRAFSFHRAKPRWILLGRSGFRFSAIYRKLKISLKMDLIS